MHTDAHTHTLSLPDGLCVDVHRSDSLEQELDHLQKRVAGLFGAAKLFSDVSLQNKIQIRTFSLPQIFIKMYQKNASRFEIYCFCFVLFSV